MASFLVPQKLDYITKGFDRTTLRWYNFERLALNDIPYRRDPTSAKISKILEISEDHHFFTVDI